MVSKIRYLDRFIIYHNGMAKGLLNESLMKKQKCMRNLSKIKALHQTKLDIYDAIRAETDAKQLTQFAKDLTHLEFELQKQWKFPEDYRFHRFWEAPKCLCPRLDNMDAIGTEYFTITRDCPLHGDRK